MKWSDDKIYAAKLLGWHTALAYKVSISKQTKAIWLVACVAMVITRLMPLCEETNKIKHINYIHTYNQHDHLLLPEHDDIILGISKYGIKLQELCIGNCEHAIMFH